MKGYKLRTMQMERNYWRRLWDFNKEERSYFVCLWALPFTVYWSRRVEISLGRRGGGRQGQWVRSWSRTRKV